MGSWGGVCEYLKGATPELGYFLKKSKNGDPIEMLT